MGVDEALLAGLAAGAPPTLRLYRWQGPWLSLGYAQSPTPERVAACARAGVGLVRRVTGGGAVLHGADLTYALVAPEDALPPRLEGAYALVTDALLRALAALGVRAERAGPAAPDAGRAGSRPFDCFQGVAQEEIRARAPGAAAGAEGRKLVGSAQRRAGGAVLQHGSIRLAPDPPAASAAAGLDPDAATSLAELGCDASLEALVEACVRAFADRLGARLETGALTPAEEAAARERTRAHPRDPLAAPLRAAEPPSPQGPPRAADKT